jgi:hypothetical protein
MLNGFQYPLNIDPKTLRVAPEQGRFHGVKRPEAMRQQRADEAREAAKQLLGKHWGKTVFEGPFRVPRPNSPKQPDQQRREAEQSQPKPAEQQTPQRRRTRGELARLAQNSELKGLAKELFGGISDQAASKFIEMAAQDYPELPPDEALRKLDRDMREDPFSGFTFP